VTRFVRSPNVLSRRVGGEVLLAHPSRPEVDRLSDSARAVWTLLEEPDTAPAVVAALSEAYGVPPNQIEADVRALLDDLVQRGWVEEVASNGE
jgi:Coenzyme PQQ synthesis protein D (PqqD)